jgi:hypothetical protein
MVVDRSLRNLSHFGDMVHAGVIKAMVVKNLHRRCQDSSSFAVG